jgi:hypothetical protein
MVNQRLICKFFDLCESRFYGRPCSDPRPCCPRIGNGRRLFRCRRDVVAGSHGAVTDASLPALGRSRARPRQNIVSTEKSAVSQRKHAVFCELESCLSATGPTRGVSISYMRHFPRGTCSRSVFPSPCGIGPTDRAGCRLAYQKLWPPHGQ